MRKILFVLVVVLTVLLSSCGNSSYEKFGNDISINGYQVYEYVNDRMICDRISQFAVFFEEDDNYYLAGEHSSGIGFSDGCRDTLYVKDDDVYINLTVAIERGLFDSSEILEVSWPFRIFETYQLTDYGNITHYVFEYPGEEDVLFNDSYEVNRLLLNSNSVFQSFIKEYSYSRFVTIGHIRIHNGDTIIGNLAVSTEGICDLEQGACMDDSTMSELLATYNSQK